MSEHAEVEGPQPRENRSAGGRPRGTSATNLRRTRQRALVDTVLDEADDFISAQELHATLRARKASVGLATVYRTLQALAEEGRVDVLRLGRGEAVYRRCGAGGHHHHLVCRSCGAAEDITLASVEHSAGQVVWGPFIKNRLLEILEPGGLYSDLFRGPRGNCDLLETVGCGGHQYDLVLYWKRRGVSLHENRIWIISLLPLQCQTQ